MGIQTDLVIDFVAGSLGAATSVYVGQPLGKTTVLSVLKIPV